MLAFFLIYLVCLLPVSFGIQDPSCGSLCQYPVNGYSYHDATLFDPGDRRRVSSTISLAIIEPTSRTNIPGSAEESGSCIWFMLCTSSRSVTNPLATIDNK
ncbi:hypothetical protein DTO027B5_9211 [Paecilomyces variotii]|nr:hypothetical protein DTO027B3_8214 [Paecilomyces variotii]KAJ9325933.1 hypothetical protein DTO027B5_9211 [Paecilomyces variotii]KAJ9395439.1 hypothetical protein DTO282F9_7693 [Paecilomyces variotii]